jgi:hypothetical protein
LSGDVLGDDLAPVRRPFGATSCRPAEPDLHGRSVLPFPFNLDETDLARSPIAFEQLRVCRLADLFRFSCRSIDTPARCGGDEFAIVLPETGAKDATPAGQRICERLANHREEQRLSVSVGMAAYPDDGTTI